MMKRFLKKLSWQVFLAYLLLFALPVEAAGTRVFVSIAPQKYFVQKIGGNLVSVSVMVPEGADPHTYEPKPRQMAELSKSAVYFTVGIDFEKVWLRKIAGTNPRMRIVHTDEGIGKIAMTSHRHERKNHQGNTGAGHHEGSPDPHIWLSPALVKIQAGNIMRALMAVDPKNSLKYKANYAVFSRELDILDTEFRSLFAGHKGEQFMVFHPSWGYFAQAYGLKQVPIESEGKDPKPAQLQRLIRYARERGIKVVFVQPQFSAKSAAMVSREIGGQVINVNPLAGNWADNMREVARKFRAVVR